MKAKWYQVHYYDGDGQRILERTSNGTTHFFMGNYLEQHLPGSSSEKREYIYADGVRLAVRINDALTTGNFYWFHLDHLGGTHLVTRDSGAVASTYLYDAWGGSYYEHGQGTVTDRLYTGQTRVEQDLYYYGARWYDPSLGRFLQADTILPVQQGTQGWDRYAYVNNNPVNGTDPTGMWMCDPYDIACAEDGDLNLVIFIGGWDGVEQSSASPLMPSLQNQPGTLYLNYDAKDSSIAKSDLAEMIVRERELDIQGKYNSTTIIGHSAGGDVGLFAMEKVDPTIQRSLVLMDPGMATSTQSYEEMFGKLDSLVDQGVRALMLYGPSEAPFLRQAEMPSRQTYSINMSSELSLNHNYFYKDPAVLSRVKSFLEW